MKCNLFGCDYYCIFGKEKNVNNIKMKTIFFKIALLLSVIGLISTSCKKEETSTDNNEGGSSTITYIVTLKIDDNAEIKYKYEEGYATVKNDKLLIGAYKSDERFDLTLNKNIVKGTYYNGYLIEYVVNSEAPFIFGENVESSTLTVSTHDVEENHIVGTFSVNFLIEDDPNSHNASGTFDATYE